MVISALIFVIKETTFILVSQVPYLCSNIPSSPYMGVYISQLIPYAGANTNYSDFLERHKYLRNRLLNRGYEKCVSKGLLLNSFSDISHWLKNTQFLLTQWEMLVFVNCYLCWCEPWFTDYDEITCKSYLIASRKGKEEV